MDKAREFLKKFSSSEEADRVSRLTLPPHRPNIESSFFEYFAIRGVRVDRVEPGFVSCSFKVPPRLIDGNGNLAMAAITSLVDVIGAVVVYQQIQSWNLSIDMSISNISAAKVNDDLEIISRCLGRKGKYSGAHVLIRNKTTGAVVAEGRHSLYTSATSKM